MRKSRSGILLFILMGAAGAGAMLLTPHIKVTQKVSIETLVPKRFGSWIQNSDSIEQVSLSVANANDPTKGDRPLYDQMLMRTYTNSRGARIMLAVAYAYAQSEELKIHRPELCYYSQGFSVSRLGKQQLRISANRAIPSIVLFAKNADRLEPITYWVRIDDKVVLSPWQARWNIFVTGLKGNVADGILVRVSSLVESDAELDTALDVQREFILALFQAMPPQGQKLLVGS